MALVIGFLYTGCEVADTKKEMPKAAPEGAAITIQDPEKMAGDLWNLIKGEDYQSNWKMWPGRGAMYEGFRPHGVFLTTYVNDAAYNAIVKKDGEMPYGAIIVKENYLRDKSFISITVMCKIKGYNTEGGDWFWAKLWPDGSVKRRLTLNSIGEGVLLAGKVGSCLECHSRQSENDYVYTGSLQ